MSICPLYSWGGDAAASNDYAIFMTICAQSMNGCSINEIFANTQFHYFMIIGWPEDWRGCTNWMQIEWMNEWMRWTLNEWMKKITINEDNNCFSPKDRSINITSYELQPQRNASSLPATSYGTKHNYRTAAL